VIVCNTIDLVVYVDGKRNAVKALIANTAAEATGMVGFSHSLQNLKKKKIVENRENNMCARILPSPL